MGAIDHHENSYLDPRHAGPLDGSLRHWVAVTPGDTVLPFKPTAVLVAVAGALDCTGQDVAGTAVRGVVPLLTAGVWHPMRPDYIHATGTTATGIWIGE